MRYLKTYKTRDNEALIKLKYAGVDVSCHFVNGNIRFGKWATLTTSNEIVQRAIETSSLYGRVILPEGAPIPIEEEDKPKKDPSEITTWAEFRDLLVDEYGCDRSKISSPSAMKARAAEFGIQIPEILLSK